MIWSVTRRYGIALLTVALAVAAKLWLAPLVRWESPFLLFFGAVMISAWQGGLGAGLLATVLATIASSYFFLTPVGQWLSTDPLVNLQIGIFLLEGMLISALSGLLHTSRRRAGAALEETERQRLALAQSEERFRALVDGVKDFAILMLSPSGKVTGWNSGAARLFGYRAGDINGQHVSILFDESARQQEAPAQALHVARSTGRYEGVEGLEKRDGPRFLGNLVINALQDDGGKLRAFSMIARDVTERRQIEEELELSRHELEARVAERTAQLEEANARLQLELAERRRAQAALQEATQRQGLSLAEVEQRTREIALLNQMADLLQACQTDEEAYDVIARFAGELFPTTTGALYVFNDSQNLVSAVADWGESSAVWQQFAPNECWALRRGRVHVHDADHVTPRCQHVRDSASPVYLCLPLMAQGELLGVLHLQLDPAETGKEGRAAVSEPRQRLATTLADHIALALSNLKLRDTLRHQAIHDPLTGLFNRRYMEEFLDQELQRADRSRYTVGVIMLDIDHFKQLNDTYGHAAGDSVLRHLGQFLREHIRGGDVACRYGGEEFVLILPEALLEHVYERAALLRESVKQLRIMHEGQAVDPITLSLGVASFPMHGSDAEQLLRSADLALYQAKAEGRDRVIISANL
jgi:diguanylate cyclase (GGDEF)-like protein/PAS domain S-box-containing protein